MFTYTQEEMQHLSDLCEFVFLKNMFFLENIFLEQQDSNYFRHCAACEREERIRHPYGVSMHGYPHPDDCEIPTSPEEYEEMADNIDCGMYRDEWM